MSESRAVSRSIRESVQPLTDAAGDYGPLLERIGDARFVLLGEATHGTREFYRARAAITRRLILEKGFTAVAVEADWPDAQRVNRWVRGTGKDRQPADALGDFQRFPAWMWRNTEVLAFVDWLRSHNAALPPEAPRVGFYGLDLYSLSASMRAVLAYLDRVDPDAAARARYRYSCFGHYGEDPQTYGYVASLSLTRSCEDEVVAQLLELRRLSGELAQRDGRLEEDAFFDAEQNARLAMSAEAYYRTMFEGGPSSWNLRDRHMAETLERLAEHDLALGRGGRIVVWAHNSHVGDARATGMAEIGEVSLGQIARERFGDDVVLVGFTTYAGTVTAAHRWDGPAERMRIRPALPESLEALLHETGAGNFMILPDTPADGVLGGILAERRLERAIGVVYRPETERISHYFDARPVEQFDVLLHFDETRAVEPLEPTAGWRAAEAKETFPTGL
jgi:erythromycin esterase-like protein